MGRLRPDRRRGGFSLIDLVVTVSVVSVLVGASLPAVATLLERQRLSATLRELEGLAEAAAAYFQDVQALPASIADLELDPGVAGWSGPYLTGIDLDGTTGLSQFSRDGWDAPYAVAVAPDGNTWSVTSSGPDGVPGTGDDPSIQLDAVPLRRALTLERLARLDQAIRRYNALYLPLEPLPQSVPELVAALEASGILTDSTGLSQDGWGDPFEPYPPGASPVVRLRSPNLPAVASGS